MYNAIGEYLIKENIKDNNLKHKTKLHQPKVEFQLTQKFINLKN